MDKVTEKQFTDWGVAINALPDGIEKIRAEMELSRTMFMFNMDENLSLIRDILAKKLL